MTNSKKNLNNTYFVKDRITGGAILMTEGRVIARNIIPESICFYFGSGITAGLFDVPKGEKGSCMNFPVHFFVYSNKTKETYVYKKDSVVLSSVYKAPICCDKQNIQSFKIEDGTADWENIYEVGFDQRVFKNTDDRVCIEYKISSGKIEFPICIDRDNKIKNVSCNELRRFLWKNIYYGLADGKIYDVILRDCLIPENDTIDSIRGLIKSIDDGKYNYKMKHSRLPDLDSPSTGSMSVADIDKMIEEIDKRIAELEEEERREKYCIKHKKTRLYDDTGDDYDDKNAETETKEKKELPLIKGIVENGKEYQFCSDDKLDSLKDFLYIIENYLHIYTDENITNLLIRMIYSCVKIFPLKSNIIFPSDEFNSLLDRTFSSMSKKERIKIKAELLRDISVSKSKGLSVLKPYYFDSYYGIQKMDDDIPFGLKKNYSALSMIDYSVKNRVGWVAYSVSVREVYITHVEAVQCGLLKNMTEIHPNIDRNKACSILKGDHKYAEVYFDLNDRLFHIVNEEDIPLDKLLKAMRTLESGEVEFCIDEKYIEQDNDKTLDKSETIINININDELPNKYISRFFGVKYFGVATLCGDDLHVRRIFKDNNSKRINNHILSEKILRDTDDRFYISYDNSGFYIIKSERFNMSVISKLIKIFDASNWKWLPIESGQIESE